MKSSLLSLQVFAAERQGASADKLHVKAVMILSLDGAARSKKGPLNRGHIAQYIHRPQQPDLPRGDDLAMFLCMSGTASRQKRVARTHADLASSLANIVALALKFIHVFSNIIDPSSTLNPKFTVAYPAKNCYCVPIFFIFLLQGPFSQP